MSHPARRGCGSARRICPRPWRGSPLAPAASPCSTAPPTAPPEVRMGTRRGTHRCGGGGGGRCSPCPLPSVGRMGSSPRQAGIMTPTHNAHSRQRHQTTSRSTRRTATSASVARERTVSRQMNRHREEQADAASKGERLLAYSSLVTFSHTLSHSHSLTHRQSLWRGFPVFCLRLPACRWSFPHPALPNTPLLPPRHSPIARPHRNPPVSSSALPGRVPRALPKCR